MYKLRDENNKEYLSDTPGLLGGNKSLKIYGHLDCSSALRWIAKGHYIRHRVFFKDEETAIKAGYRPCAVCMPEAYKTWKSNTT
jgi:methylphosphotriester-DNA--protein-cysteine methyltransferase